MIEVKIDDRELLASLQSLERAAGNLAPALREIGEVLTESTKQRFGTGIGPDGQKWDKNADVTIERKGRDKPLVDEGSLAEQIHYAVLDPHTLEIGSSMEYAAMQQFGGTKDEFPHLWGDIPARPFLGLSEDDKGEILDIIGKHLKNAI